MGALIAVVLAAVLFFVFRRLENTGRATTVVAIIWALLLIEVALYPNQSTVPPGVFHPNLGGLSFRLLDLVVPIAVIARISSQGMARFGGNALLWGAFLAWIATAGVIGIVNGHPFAVALFEAKAIAYISAIYLTATIPAREYLASHSLTRLIGAASALALVLIVTDTAQVAIDLGARPPEDADIVAGGEPLDPAGTLGADAASIFVALGVLALAVAFNVPEGRRRTLLMVAAGPLFASTIAAGQRAAFLELGVALFVLVVLVVLSNRRLRTSGTEILLAGMIVAALVLTPTLISTVRGDQAERPPFAEEIELSVAGPEERQTTEGRVYQWQTAVRLIGERPVFGWGLGREFSYFDPGFVKFFKVDITHNIGLDLLMRTGVIGLLLFLAALGTTVFRGLRAWFGIGDDLVAALALGAAAAVGGLIVKGMAESLFEKYRIAIALALLLGMLVSAASAFEQSRAPGSRGQGLRTGRGAPLPARP